MGVTVNPESSEQFTCITVPYLFSLKAVGFLRSLSVTKSLVPAPHPLMSAAGLLIPFLFHCVIKTLLSLSCELLLFILFAMMIVNPNSDRLSVSYCVISATMSFCSGIFYVECLPLSVFISKQGRH